MVLCLWCPSVLCPKCKYPNDQGFSFYQCCGLIRLLPTRPSPSSLVQIDLPSIDDRLASIRSQRRSLPYGRQKSLQKQLEDFLSSLPSPKNLQSAAPIDITRFLVWKDKHGKTKVHTPQCPLFGTHSKRRCNCPTHLAAGTVNSTIGKLRAVFNDAGRHGPWNELFCFGNPASDNSVQSYLQFITKEQTTAHVSPKQAMPLFFDKLSILTHYLVSKAFSSGDLTPIQRYIFARDAAFFALTFSPVIEVQTLVEL